MSGQPDDRAGPHDSPRVLHREIVLTDVDAVGAGETRDIGTIVDDELCAGGMRAAHEILGQTQARFAGDGLVAELQEACAAAKAGVGQGRGLDALQLAEGDVDDRVERTQTASARPALPLFLGVM
jgi:hypothetical protein